MPSFDELVRGKVPEKEAEPKINGIRCIPNTGRYEDSAEKWPTKFWNPPMVGDFVSSRGGRRLQIISITHYPNGMAIELGLKRTESTPTEGGAKSEGYV